MQEAIKKIMEAEKKAADIVAAAHHKADEMLSSNNTALSGKLNKLRENELERYNRAVEDAEKQHQHTLDEIKASESDINIDIDSVSEQVIKRVMKTIFD